MFSWGGGGTYELGKYLPSELDDVERTVELLQAVTQRGDTRVLRATSPNKIRVIIHVVICIFYFLEEA